MRLVFLSCILPTICVAFVAPKLSKIRANSVPLMLARKSAKADAANDDSPQTTNPAKKAALDGVLSQIERSYGRGSIVKLGDAEGMVVDSIGSGALTLGELF